MKSPMGYAYLDHNATAPLLPAVAETMSGALSAGGNPSSVHRAGREARRLVEDARESVAQLAGVDPAGVVFTSGGTEANVLALRGAGVARVVVSAVEHDSVLAACPDATRIPVDGQGRVRIDALEQILATGEGRALVSVMAANNETGVIQPLQAVARVARAHGALLHVDAVQAAGRIDLAAITTLADMVTLSAHKLGGSAGVGALVLAPGVELTPLVPGGQERRRRGGTENLAGIAGFGVAAEAARASLDDQPRLARLRDRLEALILATAPDATLHGSAADRLANTSCVGMPGVPAETQVIAFDLAGFAVSAGAACSSGKVARSHVLDAMGLPEADAGSAIRVSLGTVTSEAEIDAFAAAWATLYERTRQRAA